MATVMDRVMQRRFLLAEGCAPPASVATGESDGIGLDLDLVRDSTRDLQPPTASMKTRIERLILLEHGENIVGWLILTVVLVILGSFGGSMERAAFWLCFAILIVETMMKLTRKFVREYFLSGVPCSFIMLRLAEDAGRYHGFLAAVWLLRLAGILTQPALAGTLAGRIRSQESMSIEQPTLDRLVETVYCCVALVFVQVLLSLVIAALDCFHTTPTSVGLGVKRLVVREPRQPDSIARATSTASAVATDTVAREEKRVMEALSALVWYSHCKEHPMLPAVCAYGTEGSCGLPGHWFLTVEQLIERAFCTLVRKTKVHASGISNQLNMEQEMALDALARYAKSRNRRVCELIVREGEGRGVLELSRIATFHTYEGCRERAALILFYLSSIMGVERGYNLRDPYDPFHGFRGFHDRVLDVVGVDMLRCLADTASPQLQENAAGTLCCLAMCYDIGDRIFSGQQGKSRLENMVDIVADGALTDTACGLVLNVFASIVSSSIPYAHSVRLETVDNFRELSADPGLGSSAPRRRPIEGVYYETHKRLKDEKSWILPARGAFRESRALPAIVDLALSNGASAVSRTPISCILLFYVSLETQHIFPFEIAELTRLLQIQSLSQSDDTVFSVLALCNLFVSYFERDMAVEVERDTHIVQRLIEQEGRRFFANLAQLQLEM